MTNYHVKHAQIGYCAYKMGEAHNPNHGRETALHSAEFAASVQAAYDEGWNAGVQDKPAPAAPLELEAPIEQEKPIMGDLFG